MENTKKIIILSVFILFSCKSKPEFKHLKENLFLDKEGQIFMKLSNKSPMNPSLGDNWKDTIYIQYFHFKYDSLININDIINVKEFKLKEAILSFLQFKLLINKTMKHILFVVTSTNITGTGVDTPFVRTAFS